MRNYLLHPRTNKETKKFNNQLEKFTNEEFRALRATRNGKGNILEVKRGKKIMAYVHSDKNQVIYTKKANIELARYLSKIYEINFKNLGEWMFNFKVLEKEDEMQ